ncbi:hypothetical protein KEJ47_10500, partial [Candidatus Bathyarchaeota archaeon]|nr:hypothetical protein [Candidatus Bathyarchaeota archaeon]
MFKIIGISSIIGLSSLISFAPLFFFPHLPHEAVYNQLVDVSYYSSRQVTLNEPRFLSVLLFKLFLFFFGPIYSIPTFTLFLTLLSASATYLFSRSLGFPKIWSLLSAILSTLSFQTVAGIYAYIVAQWLVYALHLFFLSLLAYCVNSSRFKLSLPIVFALILFSHMYVAVYVAFITLILCLTVYDETIASNIATLTSTLVGLTVAFFYPKDLDYLTSL